MTKYSKEQLADSQAYLDRMVSHGKYIKYAMYVLLTLIFTTVASALFLEDSPWLLLPVAIGTPLIIGLTIKAAGPIGASWWAAFFSMFIPIGLGLWATITITSLPEVIAFFERTDEVVSGAIIIAGILVMLALSVVFFLASIHFFDRVFGVKRFNKSFWRI